MSGARLTRGFTMIELVVSIVIATIVVGVMSALIGGPMDMYMSQSRRAELDDAAENLWRNMEHDLVTAIPNSVRFKINGSIRVLELLPAADWARYFAKTSNGFDVAGGSVLNIKQNMSITLLASTTGDPYSFTDTTYKKGVRSDVTAGSNGEAHVDMNGSFPFGDSPTSRVYFFTYPVTYLCDTRAQTVTRYTNYQVTASQSSVDTVAKLNMLGATGTLIATKVADCAFGVSQNLVTANMTLSAAGTNSGTETVRSFHELCLENVP